MATGWLADLLALAVLVQLWHLPPPGLWWLILAGLVVDWHLSAALRRSLRHNGLNHRGSRRMARAALGIQALLIALALMALFG